MASNKTRPNINDISGFDISTTPQPNDVLQFDGTSWVNAPFTGGGGGGSGGDRIVDAVDGTTVLAVEKGSMSLSIDSINVLSADDVSMTLLSPTQNLNQWWVKVDEGNVSGQAFGMSVCVDPAIGHTYAIGGADTTKPYVISFDAAGNLRWKHLLTYESYSHLTNNNTFIPTGVTVNESAVYVTLYSVHSISIIIAMDKATGSVMNSNITGTSSADNTTGLFTATAAGPNKVLAVGMTSSQQGRLDVMGIGLGFEYRMEMTSSAPNGAIMINSIDMKSEDYATIGFTEGYDTYGIARVNLTSTPTIMWASKKSGITVGGVAASSTGESYAVSHVNFIDWNMAFTVTKFSTSGTVVWAKSFTTVGNGEFVNVMRYTIACDASTGDVFVWGTCNESSPTYTDWFLLSLSPDGATRWCKRIGHFVRNDGTLYNQSEGIGYYDTRFDAIDVSNQNVVVVGQTSQLMFVGSFDVAGGIPTSTLMEVVDITSSVRSLNATWFASSTNYQLTSYSPNFVSLNIFATPTLVPTDKHKLIEPSTFAVAGDVNVMGRLLTDGVSGLPGESLIATADGVKWGTPPSPVSTNADYWNIALTPDPTYNPFNINSNNAVDNIAIGPGVMSFSTGINDSVSIGIESQQYATNANWCVSIGYETAQNIETGDYNVALGYRAFFGDFGNGGSNNIAIGSNAMYRSSGIEDSIALGYNTMRNTTTAYQTVAIGYEVMKNVTNASSSNIAIGNMAMGWCATPGVGNVAIGEGALYYANAANPNTNTSNVAIGSWALGYPNAAFRNTAVGGYALSYDAYDNCTGIGYNTSVTGANQVQLGDSATTTYVYGTVQNRSDARDKADVRDTSLGLAFIESLRPVDYRWDYRSDYVYTFTDDYGNNHDTLSNKRAVIDDHGNQVIITNNKIDGSRKRTRYHHGLIAQEVKQVSDDLGLEFGGYQDHNIAGGEDVLSIGYDELIAPLIKAVQELSKDLTAAKQRIAELESKMQ